MKVEHRAIIDRCARTGDFPAEVASQLLEHDLVQTCLDQLRGQVVPYGKLGEQAQQETIERITKDVQAAVRLAITTIAANGVAAVPVDVKRVQVDEKKLTVTAVVDAKDPKKHDLIDSAGRLCLLVMAPDDYSEALDDFVPDRDQGDLPLHAGRIAENFEALAQAQLDVLEAAAPADPKPSPAPDADPSPAPAANSDANQFGDLDYVECKQVVVLHGNTIDRAWLNRRFGINDYRADSLVLRLLEDQIIAIKDQPEDPALYTYTVEKSFAEMPLE